MSATHEEALSRAKAIAARLSGQDTSVHDSATAAASSPPSTTTSTGKRKRWGVAPAIVAQAAAAATDVLPGLMDAAKQAKTANNDAQNSKRIWMPTTKERPPSHFRAFCADRLHQIQDEINNDSNNSSASSSSPVKLELKGRGASSEPPLPGIPLEPMHVMIYGTDAQITQAEQKVDSLIVEAESAPVEHVEDEEDSNENPNKYALALTTTGRQASYRPATVAQLISNNPIPTGDDLMEETVNVPNGVVGFLIGRGGETISSMQARSGCKVQIQKEHELQPGQTHRVITLQAASQESIDQCRGMIESMVQDRIRAAGGPGGSSSKDVKVSEAVMSGHKLVTVDVPDADVGLIIGKSGATIKSIQETTGASIQIPPSGNLDNPSIRTVSITHPNVEAANIAKKQIEELLKSKPSYSRGGAGGGGGDTGGPQITLQVMIPDRDVGLCIGRQGCVIREMQHKTGTRIQIPSQPTPGQPHRVATVSGTRDGCNQVQGLIERIITEQSSACVLSGTPHAANHNQFYQQPYQDQGGVNHQSAEWQAYYAAQAVAKQQQPAAAAPAPAAHQQNHAAAAAQQPGADAYYEQFFRYAYYYGEDAARQYYGAWSPPPGTPNPYGVNPNGVQAAPAPAPGASPVAAAPAPAYSAPAPAYSAPAPENVRDSSVRKVSNLPAWMTKSN